MRVDLRSDTVTLPTAAMRKAMFDADLGDDVYGEDPSVNRLQEKAAELMGKEDALFFPSGSMANLSALLSLASPGSEVIVESSSHIYNYELASMAVVGGVLPRVVAGERGQMSPDAIREAVHPPIYYRSAVSLICLENSHNMAGGAILDLAYMDTIRLAARQLGLPIHLDGARIFNAATALGVEPRQIAARADTVMFCLSKGLCAPIGSLLAGDREVVERARVHRKRLGGGMRQAGVLAAAGIVALDTVPPLLRKDHDKIRRIEDLIKGYDFISYDPETVRTNILVFEIVHPAATSQEIVASLQAEGILCGTFGAKIRFVTHQDISEQMMEYTLSTLERVFSRLS